MAFDTNGLIRDGLTFDDVLLEPGPSDVLPSRGRYSDAADAKPSR